MTEARRASAFDIRPAGFDIHGARCAADLYLPAAPGPHAVVVMAHGFGAERAFRLPAYAAHFAASGLAVLLFDYRGFGDSTGEPRQLVDPRRHLQDWQAAIGYARSRPELDPQRIALFGTSYSGGHVIVTAARDPGIRALVAQVPFVDPFSTMWKLGPLFTLRALPHGLLDAAKALLGLAPHYVRVVSQRGGLAMLPVPDAYEGVMRIVPPGSQWTNRCCARIALAFALYRPVAVAAQVRCPALLMLAARDTLIAPAAVERAAARMRRAELLRFDCGHFDIYHDPVFTQALARQTAFLRTNLNAP